MEQIQQFLINYSQAFASSLFILAVALITWLIFSVLFKNKTKTRRIQLIRRAGKRQIWQEVSIIIRSSIVGSFIGLFTSVLLTSGVSQIYTDINQYGILYAIFTFIVLLFVGDTWFYWVHRVLHHPRIYKYIHAVHHKSVDVTPFTSNSFHWIESSLLTLYVTPVLMFVPIWQPIIILNLFIGTLNNLKSHLGYEIFPKWFTKTPLKYLINSVHHNLHHTQYNGNYGLTFRFWDLVCGTEFDNQDSKTMEMYQRAVDIEIIDNTKYRPLKVTKIVQETKDTKSVYFDELPKEFKNYFAGQHVNVKLKIDGGNVERIFSLSSSPEDKFLCLTMKLNGVFTHHVFNQLKVGDKMGVKLPVGEFKVKPDPNKARHYLMVAGGSGITAIYSMIKSLLHNEPKSKITLFYANKSRDTKIFASELDSLQANFNNLKVVDFFSSKGKRITQTDIKEFVKRNPLVEIYVCGPEGMKEAVKKYIKQSKIRNKKVQSEAYVEGYVKTALGFGII